MLPPSAWSIVETIATDDAPRYRATHPTAPTRRHVRMPRRWGHAR